MTRAGGRSFPHFKRESTAFARTPKLGVPTEIMNKAFVGTPNLGVFTGIMNKAFVLSFPQSPPAQKLSFPQSFKRESIFYQPVAQGQSGFPLKDCGNDTSGVYRGNDEGAGVGHSRINDDCRGRSFPHFKWESTARYRTETQSRLYIDAQIGHLHGNYEQNLRRDAQFGRPVQYQHPK